MTETGFAIADRPLAERSPFNDAAPDLAADAPMARRSGAARRRALLALGCAAGLACALWPEAGNWAGAEADLVRLMKAMAVIKGLAAAALALAVWRRFGRTIGWGAAAAYALGASLALAGVALIFSLAGVMLGSALFYLGAGLALAAAFKDRELRARLSERAASLLRSKFTP